MHTIVGRYVFMYNILVIKYQKEHQKVRTKYPRKAKIDLVDRVEES